MVLGPSLGVVFDSALARFAVRVLLFNLRVGLGQSVATR
jgi:hypothetical protein